MDKANLGHDKRMDQIQREKWKRWTKEEDKKLIAVIKDHGPKNWKFIATEAFEDKRTDVQCLHRWFKVLDPKLEKGPWTDEEDARLVELVEQRGTNKWAEVSAFFPGRIGKQLRERWGLKRVTRSLIN